MPTVYNPTTGAYTQSPAAGGALPGGLMRSGNAVLRAPSQAQTVAGNLERLQRTPDQYMQQNMKQGQQFAARRGLLNSSMAAQAGQQAAIAGALPIAQADAQLSAQADAQNAEALNQIAVADLAVQAANAGARSGGAGSNHDQMAQIAFEREQNALDREQRGLDRTQERDLTIGGREFDSLERALDRGLTREDWDQQQDQAALDRGLTREDWDRQRDERQRDRDYNTADREDQQGYEMGRDDANSRRSMFRDVMQQTLSTILSDPALFGDPGAAHGLMRFFSGSFSELFDSFLGPSRTGQPATTPPGGG